ncbi:response regulator [Marinivivus vitaminiproducens]|uniref:response regulator n=1 Tax=Marinivivus vitaminiproducens TaxID=3035935 RepID=UPI0027A08054|nr:response regulator [Geminicoccaceae bacterium SCSIO 64248]
MAAPIGTPAPRPRSPSALRAENERLRQQLAEAERSRSTASRFVASVSHELREPMNGVIGMARLLLDTPLSDEQKGYVDSVLDSAQSLVTIVNDILDQSKLEGGQLELHPVAFDLHALTRRLHALFAPQAAARGVGFDLRVDERVPAAVTADPGRLRQVLVNLLGNALRFTREGSIGLAIDGLPSDTADRARLRFTVSDTGVGIAEADRARVFEPFRQAAGTQGGTGLGLTIARALVGAMGGRLEVDSQIGVGTRFGFTLDLGHAEPTTPRPDAARLARIRLLVVDADETAGPALLARARSLGVDAVLCDAAHLALDASRRAVAERRPFDIVLIDHTLADGDGLALGRRIKADPTLAAARLVLLAAAGLRGDAARAADHGFAAYLTRPIASDTLAACLRRLCDPAEPGEILTVHSLTDGRTPSWRVLVVDDNPMNRTLLVRTLEKAGHRVDQACDGREAVDAVVADAYDIVLMDVQMPHLDGIEATRLIRRLRSPKAETPVIAITAHVMREDEARCRAAGINAHIAKPIDRIRLLAMIEEFGAANGSALPATNG